MQLHPIFLSHARVLVAPDKFKGTLAAADVCRIVAEELQRVNPTLQAVSMPMADGGEGTAPLLATLLHLTERHEEGRDPLMRPITYTYYSDEERTTCAVDSASLTGLTLLRSQGEEYDVWHTSSHPLGEFLARRLAEGFTRIYVGVGGTGTVDGGAGMLQALGARFFDEEGVELPSPIRACDLLRLRRADLSALPRSSAAGRVVMLSDVDVALLPQDGQEALSSPKEKEALSSQDGQQALSSLSFAKQKGVTTPDLPRLAHSLRRFTELLGSHPELPFQGAGGGIGYALHAVLGAEAHAGGAYIMERFGLFSSPPPSLLITGEGRFDSQSMSGKVVGTLMTRASELGVPVVVISGCAEDGASSLLPSNATLITCTAGDCPSSPSEAEASLRCALRRWLASLSPSPEEKNEG